MFVLIHGTLDALGMLDTMMAGALPADTTDPAMGTFPCTHHQTLL
jgi:hypothetical protein